MFKIIFYGLLCSLLYPLNLFAQDQYSLNPDHSQLSFEIDYLKVSRVKGHFSNFSGWATLDKQLVIQKANLTILADSITTHEPKRDTHLKKRDFLAVSNHPTISFQSNSAANMNGNKGTISGDLIFLGKKHPIKLQLELLGSQIDPWEKKHVFYQASTELDRKKLGIHWNKLLDQGGLLVGEKIRVEATLQLQPQGQKTSFSTHMVPGAPSGPERQALPKKSLEQIKKQYSSKTPDKKSVSKSNKKQTDQQKSVQATIPKITTWQWFQIGVLSFFALFGAICMGVGLKYVVEKSMPYGRFQHVAEVIFILLVFALSACLYTLMRLLLETS